MTFVAVSSSGSLQLFQTYILPMTLTEHSVFPIQRTLKSRDWIHPFVLQDLDSQRPENM